MKEPNVPFASYAGQGLDHGAITGKAVNLAPNGFILGEMSLSRPKFTMYIEFFYGKIEVMKGMIR